MMQIIRKTNINFVGVRQIAVTASIVLIVVGIVSVILHKGLNLSIDFAGGTLIQVKFEKPVSGDLGKIRSIVSGLNYGTPEVKTIGQAENNELQLTVADTGKGTAVSDEIQSILKNEYADNPFEVRKVEKVGPKIGGELRKNSIIAALLSLLVILIYIGFRFHLPFGVAAVIPLFHDVLITLTVFSLLNREMSLTFLAALLTIIGYSLNDTIVIFDRIRENMRTGSIKGDKFLDLVNSSINQTLSRTLITSLTTLFVVTSLFILGSETIKDFALALMIGIIVGTYSTIYIASPVLIWWHKKWPIANK